MLLLVFCDLVCDLAYRRSLEGNGTSTRDLATHSRARRQLDRQA